MRILLLFFALAAFGRLGAQTVPFIKADQLTRWREAPGDTLFVINFWATWCEPCVAELPSFEKLHQAYGAKNVRVVLVSMDFKKQVETRLLPFIRENGLQSAVAFMDERTANKWINLVDPAWSGAIPATWIVGKHGEKFMEAKLEYDELEAAVLELLNKN